MRPLKKKTPEKVLDNACPLKGERIETPSSLKMKEDDSWRNHRKQRSIQLENFPYVFLNTNFQSPDDCKARSGIAMHNTQEAICAWVNCDNEPRCYCNMLGLSARVAKRRNIELPD